MDENLEPKTVKKRAKRTPKRSPEGTVKISSPGPEEIRKATREEIDLDIAYTSRDWQRDLYIGLPLFFAALMAWALLSQPTPIGTAAGIISLILAGCGVYFAIDFFHKFRAYIMLQTLAGRYGRKDATVDPIEGRIRTLQAIESDGHLVEQGHYKRTWKPAIWTSGRLVFSPMESEEEVDLKKPYTMY